MDDDEEIAQVPRRRKLRARKVRDPGGKERYQARKEAGLCTKCGEPALPDQQKCQKHLDTGRVATAKSMKLSRRALRAQGLCANRCGRRSESYFCLVCRVRAGETPIHSPPGIHGAIHAGRSVNPGVNPGAAISDDVARAIHRPQVLDKITYSDGKTRNRSRGSNKRGGANQTAFVVDGQNLRYAKAALEKAIAGCVACEAPEVKELSKVQRLARRREWEALVDLARRHLTELLQGSGYDDDIESE